MAINFKAESNPRGGQVDLSWSTPTASEFPNFKGVKILRREFTKPTLQDIGTDKEIHDDSATPAGRDAGFFDEGLKSETVYYYALVAYDNAMNFSDPSTASAMATGAYRTADDLYSYLPAIYQRYDTLKPPGVPELDSSERDRGQLRRLIEMFGLQFDLLRSFASGVRDFSDIDRVDGELLPLLARWIGWQTDFTLPLDKQRNEIRYAPHFYRTTGIAANLQATLNRLVTWNPQIKEFVHNVFLTNTPEQLTISELERRNGQWQPAKPVTLDVAYEGRPSVVQANGGQTLLFYHARQNVTRPQPLGSKKATEDRWHIWYKAYDESGYLPARRITFDGDINKHPAALRKSDGNFWLFWTEYKKSALGRREQISLQIFATGRAAQPPRVRGTAVEPFSFADGDQFRVIINDGLTLVERIVNFRLEHFHDITQATAAEVAALLDAELPGAKVTTTDERTIVIESLTAGLASSLTVPASAVATGLGLGAPLAGSNATRALITGSRTGPFTLAGGDTLTIRVDQDVPRVVTFDGGSATAASVVAAINSVLPGVASSASNKVVLASLTRGEGSFISVDVNSSTAANKLGFGAALPPPFPVVAEIEPSAFEDNAGNVWLFWSSRREGVWKIFYNRFDIATSTWGSAKRLTVDTGSEREPAVVFDPGNGGPAVGKIWVFWSRKKKNGQWNIFYRTTTNMNFGTHTDLDWTQLELQPVPANFDKREPAPVFVQADNIELYFSSNRADGWKIWSNALTPLPAAGDTQITSGQFTQRAAAVLRLNNQILRLWYRGTESQTYTSQVYPDAKTLDARYAGSITVDTRNAMKIGLRKNIQDVQRYTYDVDKGNDNWYARDTVGIYLAPDTDDEMLISRRREMIESVLRSFLPIQVRVVFIIQQVYPEFVYTYADPAAAIKRLIGERLIDTILSDVYGDLNTAEGIRDLHVSDAVDFLFLRLFDAAPADVALPDLSVQPPDLSFRLFLRGVEEGE